MPTLRPPFRAPSHARKDAFTLTEILVVIGIILLLLSITFPIFKGIQERGNQTTCISNLQQIYLAVRLYKDDEREYPMSLAVLLPDTDYLQKTGPVLPAPPAPQIGRENVEGTGYFRKSQEVLVCPSDDTQTKAIANDNGAKTRSSYGDVTDGPTRMVEYETISGATFPAETTRAQILDLNNTVDWGRYSWNYWGYDRQGVAFRSNQEVVAFMNETANLPDRPSWVKNKDKRKSADYEIPPALTIDTPTFYFNPRGFVKLPTEPEFTEDPRQANPLLYSLSNPFAPDSTIITRCVFHRLPTGKDLIGPNPTDLYNPDGRGQGARDVVLRLDGTAKTYDVSQWNAPSNMPKWVVQNF